jgi:hypothetical protein
MDKYRKRDREELPVDQDRTHNVHLWVLVSRNGYGILLRPWNMYHACFDDEEMDDHSFDRDDIGWWSLCQHMNYDDFEKYL